MSYTQRSVPYMLGTQWTDSGVPGRETPAVVRDLIGSLATHEVINVLDYLTNGQPDGTTDNTSQIQAAITAAAGVARCYFPKMTSSYITTGGLMVPSNSHLIIDGTIFLKASSAHGNWAAIIQTATGYITCRDI